MSMRLESIRQRLEEAIEQLSHPFETPDDVKAASIKLDVIAAILLEIPSIAEKIGPERVAKLSAAGATLPIVMSMIGAKALAEAGELIGVVASSAEEMIALGSSSLVDFFGTEDDVALAETARERLHDALAALLPLVSEQRGGDHDHA